MDEKTNRLYAELAAWWPLLSPPEEYAEEAEFYRKILTSSSHPPPHTLLELGSGGGSNAFHLKGNFEMTLVDLSAEMLEVSRRLNPELEHIRGDMRDVRLGRSFEAVFIHDAIMYMTTEDDLRRAMETAFLHCRPGGAALFCPDQTREGYRPSSDHGGYDEPGPGPGKRGLRYLEWDWDPDPADSTTIVDYAYLLREPDGQVHCEHDRHVVGLFSQQTWLRLPLEAGFERVQAIPFEHSEVEPGSLVVYLAYR